LKKFFLEKEKEVKGLKENVLLNFFLFKRKNFLSNKEDKK